MWGKLFNSDIFWPIGLAIFGGLVRVLHRGEERSILGSIGAIITASFVGVIVFLIVQDFRISANLKAAVVGASGYGSGAMLPALERFAVNMINSGGKK